MNKTGKDKSQNCFGEATRFCSGHFSLCLWRIPSAVLPSIVGLNGFLIFPFMISTFHCCWQHPFPDTQICLFKGILRLCESSCLTWALWVYIIIFFLPNIFEISILSVTIAQNVHKCWFPYDALFYSTTTDPTRYVSLPSMSSFLQVVLHSQEHQAQFSSLICKALGKTRPSRSTVHLDLTSSPLPSRSLGAIQPCHWQICLFHSLQK